MRRAIKAFTLAVLLLVFSHGSALGESLNSKNVSMVRIAKIEKDFPLSDFSRSEWTKAEKLTVKTNWDSSPAGVGREFSAQLLYSDTGIYVLFDANQSEDLVIASQPTMNQKTIGLWDRDVFEIFLAPQNSVPTKYFEFEVSPLGEWLDVALEIRDGRRLSDWEYASGMKTAARIEKGRVLAAVFIPFTAFATVPKSGDIWRGNIFRCVGRGPTRGYLAWQPTLTPEPSFHVPERFGEFKFD
jgi:hypothetical protein